jgi:hypothetical protein
MHGWLAKMRGTLLGDEDLRTKVGPKILLHAVASRAHRACKKCGLLAITASPSSRNASPSTVEILGPLLCLVPSIRSPALYLWDAERHTDRIAPNAWSVSHEVSLVEERRTTLLLAGEPLLPNLNEDIPVDEHYRWLF